jgi:hypothetical protein
MYDIDGEIRLTDYPDIGADEFDSTGVVGIEDDDVLARGGIPEAFVLYANYPNPFNPSTFIKYDLPEAARVRLDVYDVLGRRVKTLVDEPQVAGVHSVRFDGSGLSSGIYFYRINAGKFNDVHRMLLQK